MKFLLVFLFVAGPTFGQTIDFRDDFESGMSGWDIGSELPHDGNRPGNPVQAHVLVSEKERNSGKQSIELFIDGHQDDGIVWISRYFYVQPKKKHSVKLTFQLWSPVETPMSMVLVSAYAKGSPATKEEHFDRSKPAYLKQGWKEYEYQFEVESDERGRIWVASGIAVIWETHVTHYIDDVGIQITPAK